MKIREYFEEARLAASNYRLWLRRGAAFYIAGLAYVTMLAATWRSPGKPSA